MIKALFIVGMLILSGCSSSKSNSKKLQDKIIQTLKKEHQIEHGDIVAKYDLAQIQKANCIYAKDYGRIINEEIYNNLFLKKFKSRNKSREYLNNKAAQKTKKITDLTLKLNDKYHFLSNSQLNYLHNLSAKKSSKNKNDDIFTVTKYSSPPITIADLAKLDRLSSSIPLMLPEYSATITSHYGMRKHPLRGQSKFHCGTDMVGHKSAPIYSVADGRVKGVGKMNGYGNIIEIEHSNKFKTRYAHLKTILVKEGQWVMSGQKIGLQGNTGQTTAEHLHFEIWLGSKNVDPYDFIVNSWGC